MSKTECPKHVQNSWTYIAFFFFLLWKSMTMGRITVCSKNLRKSRPKRWQSFYFCGDQSLCLFKIKFSLRLR